MSEPETPYVRLSPEAPGTEPAGFDSYPAGTVLRPERLAQLAALRDDVRRKLAGYRQRHDQSASILFQHLAYLRFDFILDEADELQTAYNVLTARAERAEVRVKEQQAELAEQERANLLLIQETHRWSAAVKKLEAERIAPVGEHELGERLGCDNCGHTDWEAYKPGLGCNLCEGL